MSSVISFVMAVLTALSGLFGEIGFAGVEEIFTDALSLLVQRSDFIGEIDDGDIEAVDESSGYVKNTVMIIFDEDAGFFSRLDALKESGGVTIGSIPDLELCVIRTAPTDLDGLMALCDKLSAHDAVAAATISPARKLETQYTPDDPFTEYDWHEEHWNESSPYGNNWWLEAIDARGAWGYDSLYENIDIGVVDGGFDTTHVELDGKIVFPSSKEASRNRPNSHGTHVAGIIAAKGDNGMGISGICQNSTLICVDWTPSDGQVWIPDLAVLTGFVEVVKAGAKVVNFSVGISSSIAENSSEFISIVNNFDAFLYSYAMGSLLSKGYDFLVVQSAGNGNEAGYAVNASQNGLFCSFKEGNVFLPFAGVSKQDLLDRVIIVGSASVDGKRYVQSSSSNVGDVVDICAPGVMVYSCTTESGYTTKSGTSMASPVVAATASLVWSVDPSLTAPEVKKLVCENTADKVEPSAERYFTDIGYRSYPMVNAKLAVEAAIMQMGDACEVDFRGYADEEVIFTADDGNEFIFETDINGKLSCVLPVGEYEVTSHGRNMQITVDEDTIIIIGG